MYSYKQNKYINHNKYNKNQHNKYHDHLKHFEHNKIKNNQTIDTDYLSEFEIGSKTDIEFFNGFNFPNNYRCNYYDNQLKNEHTHVFCSINILYWSNTHFLRNGDYKTSLYIKIPDITSNYNLEIKRCSTNYKILKIFNNTIIYDKFLFSKYMEELYIWNEKFNNDLINLPNSLILLSICSKYFNLNLTKLPNNLQFLYINSNNFDIKFTNLPKNLKVLSITSDKLTINFDNLPNGLKILHVNSNRINLNMFSNLPESLEFLYIKCYDLHKINLNLNDLPIRTKLIFINAYKKINNKGIKNLIMYN